MSKISMFNKDDRSDNKEVETIIGPSVKVRGDFKGSGDIVIDGVFEGTIETKGSIKAGESSKITADIFATNASLHGEVNGNLVLSGLLEVGPNAVITGNIEVSMLIVTKGSKINGNITMLSANKDRASAD
jgi:cytoskeletal protein CcmA (bactofilin family)